jgi:hypothetical protein
MRLPAGVWLGGSFSERFLILRAKSFGGSGHAIFLPGRKFSMSGAELASYWPISDSKDFRSYWASIRTWM